MATYQEIVDKINGITDNGNNTAAEVRSVLTDMLNYSNDGFEIAPPTVVVADTQIYYYSFKGIKNQCCNMFLTLADRTPRSTTNQVNNSLYRIELNQEDFTLLKSFLPEIGAEFDGNSYLSFSAPAYQTAIIRNIVIALYRLEGKFYVLIATNSPTGEVLMTTIPLNYKKLVMPNANGIKNKAFDKEFRANMKTNDFFGFTIDPEIIK